MPPQSWSTKLGGSCSSLLRLECATHQFLDRSLRRDVFVDDAIYLFANGHLYAGVHRDITTGGSRQHTLDDLSDAFLRGVDVFTRGQRQTETTVAGLVVGAGEYQVAKTGEPHECFFARTQRYAQTCHLDETAGDQCNTRVGAETQPIGNAGANGQHILDGAADLDADDVGRGVGPK